MLACDRNFRFEPLFYHGCMGFVTALLTLESVDRGGPLVRSGPLNAPERGPDWTGVHRTGLEDQVTLVGGTARDCDGQADPATGSMDRATMPMPSLPPSRQHTFSLCTC